MSRTLLVEEMLKIAQISFVNVRDRPVVEVAFDPVKQMITLMRYFFCRSVGISARPDKEVPKTMDLASRRVSSIPGRASGAISRTGGFAALSRNVDWTRSRNAAGAL